jgi:hypothetical protein
VSNQFPERDEDLLQALKQLAAGESANFTVRFAFEEKAPPRPTEVTPVLMM